jgi:ABC-type glycerol-3-phosphate transport system substrate-binding protein
VGGTFPLFVNLDLFEEAGVSPDEFNQSYESLHEAASKLRKGNVFGYGQSISYKDFSYQAWLPYIWGAGADVFNEDGTAGAMDTPDAAASWDFVRSLYADDLAPRPGAYDQSGLQGLFASGRLAIYPTSMGLAQTVAAGKKKINWDIFAAPPGPTGEAPLPLDYGYLTVAAKAANPDAAWAYVKHLISPDPLTEYLNTLNIGFLSPRDDTPEVNASEPRFLKAQEEFVPSGRPYPTHPKTLDALRAGCDQFELCIAGEKSGADAVRDANEAITNLLSS